MALAIVAIQAEQHQELNQQQYIDEIQNDVPMMDLKGIPNYFF